MASLRDLQAGASPRQTGPRGLTLADVGQAQEQGAGDYEDYSDALAQEDEGAIGAVSELMKLAQEAQQVWPDEDYNSVLGLLEQGDVEGAITAMSGMNIGATDSGAQGLDAIAGQLGMPSPYAQHRQQGPAR